MVVAEPAPLAVRPQDVYQEAADRIYGESLEVIEGVQMFWAIFGEECATQDDPPEEWVDEYGQDRARKLFKLAKAGLLSKQEAPMGVHVAMAHAQSVLRARAARDEKASNQTLNIGTLIQYPRAEALYPSREVDDETE